MYNKQVLCKSHGALELYVQAIAQVFNFSLVKFQKITNDFVKDSKIPDSSRYFRNSSLFVSSAPCFLAILEGLRFDSVRD